MSPLHWNGELVVPRTDVLDAAEAAQTRKPGASIAAFGRRAARTAASRSGIAFASNQPPKPTATDLRRAFR
jgi:hypothetical protein